MITLKCKQKNLQAISSVQTLFIFNKGVAFQSMKLTFLNFREYFFYANKNPEWADCVSPSEAAGLLGISRQRILQMIESGEISAAYILREGPKGKNITNSSHVFLRRQDVDLILKRPFTIKRGNPSKFFHRRFQDHPEDFIDEFKDSLSGSLFSRTKYMHDFLTSSYELEKDIADSTGRRSYGKLKEMIDKSLADKIILDPMLLTVDEGTFLPATLLSDGLWSNQYPSLLSRTKKDPTTLQGWLFEAFFNWAPSFDFNPPVSSYLVKDASISSYPYLVGQYGHRDEAYSLPVLISRELRNNIEIISETLTRNYAFQASIKGILTHKSHLSKQERMILKSNNDYCLKITNNNHWLTPSPGEVQHYGAYLWVCLGDPATVARLDNSFFIWEHADIANKDSIAFGLDSLEHKIEYIINHNKDKGLILLHKSMSLINGNPEYKPEQFYDFLLRDNFIDK